MHDTISYLELLLKFKLNKIALFSILPMQLIQIYNYIKLYTKSWQCILSFVEVP